MNLQELVRTKNITILTSFTNEKGEVVLELLDDAGMHYIYNSVTKKLQEDK